MDLISLRSNVILPVSYEHHQTSSSSNHPEIPLIIGHGLGTSNPKVKSHEKDEWIKVLFPQALLANKSYIAYTARGHGKSTGWEETAESNPEQFTWKCLAEDMVAIADYYIIPQFIACGSSMGAGTSLFSAIIHPDRVRGVILVRPPTAWTTRQERKKYIIASANKLLKKQSPEEKFHFVLRGAAMADLPPLSDDESYSRVTCPLLILTVKGDDAHPVSTATALAQKIPQTELHIAENEEDANAMWPEVILTFLRKIV